eukprot:GHVN01055186.1.p1 GENE.GHVN01055186.1~~GHVN01055186.1.p1  ORF type:complete len:1432 (+),score=262.64 GHVN01055186.1:299-4594(+)
MTTRSFFLVLLLPTLGNSYNYFKPIFHTVNDFDLQGRPCSLQRPSRNSTCPAFATNVLNADTGLYMTQSQFIQACSTYSIDMSCPQGQFKGLSGSCESCPAGSTSGDGVEVDVATGEVYCVSQTTGGRLPVEGESVTSCFGDQGAQVYRACSDSESISVMIPYYYKGEDLIDESKMQICAILFGVNYSSPETTHVFGGRHYTFPVLRNYESYDDDYGFVQCPRQAETYDFGSTGWWAVYGTYLAGFTILGTFCIYKYSKEFLLRHQAHQYNQLANRHKESNTGELTRSDTVEEMGVALDEDNNVQTGYRNDWFGVVGYAVLWALSVMLQVLLLIVILDVYGLNVWTLCDSAARDYCRQEQIDNPQFNPYWREAWTCGSGCLFSWRWTTGFDLSWPYHNNPLGGEQIYAIFMVFWHIDLVWVVCLKLVEKKIRTFFRIRHGIEYSNVILITKPLENEVREQSERDSWVDKTVRWFEEKGRIVFGEPRHVEACSVNTEQGCGRRYIIFQCQTYGFNARTGRYEKMILLPPPTYRGAQEMRDGLTSGKAAVVRDAVGANKMNIRAQPLHLNIWEEVFHYYMIYQYFCLVVWFVFVYWIPALLLTVVIIISVGIKVYEKHSGQRSVMRMAQHDEQCVVRRDGGWVAQSATSLVPGDVMAVCDGDKLTVDALILDGRCVVDESSLTGEVTPVPKAAIEPTDRAYSKMSPDAQGSTLFAGSYIESATPGTGSYCRALVISTGVQTEKGELIKTILYPPRVTFTFDQHWKLVFLILLAYGGVAFFLCFVLINWHIVSWLYGIFTISEIMSPLIPASFVNNQAIGARRLARKQIYCQNIGRIYACGKIKVMCFDKTGTMTGEGLEYHGVHTIRLKNSEASEVKPTAYEFGEVLGSEGGSENGGGGDDVSEKVTWFLGTCHSLDATTDRETRITKLAGSEVDVQVFQASKFEFTPSSNLSKPSGSADSTDSAEGESSRISVHKKNANGREQRFEIMRRFEFNRISMSMTVITRNTETGEIWVFTKGSFESVEKMMEKGCAPEDYKKKTESLARDGFYVLGMAFKPYDGPSEVGDAQREDVETHLLPLGLLVFRNELKPDTKDVINELKGGAIRCVMVTGDNALTGITIARVSQLSCAERLLVSEVVERSDGKEGRDGEVLWRCHDTGDVIKDLREVRSSLESGDTELVVTGTAFDVLKVEEVTVDSMVSQDPYLKQDILNGQGVGGGTMAVYNSRIRDLLRYTRIFARVKPFQKIDVIQLHMQTGVTGMCGDGANDAGALRAAHVGLALSSGASEATIVSSFSTHQSSLRAVCEMIKVGRAAMMSAVACYKNLICYGTIVVLVVMLQYYFGVIMSEAWFLSVDCFINCIMTFALMYAQPSKSLAPTRPTAKLLGLEVCWSVCSITAAAYVVLIASVVTLFYQDWFVCREFDANFTDPGSW